jgi:hypothetical protein
MSGNKRKGFRQWPILILPLIAGLIQLTSADWVLEWSDEFDYEGPPNPEYWGYENGYVRNNEVQYYTDDPENVRVEDGRLIITAIRTDQYDRGYSSASIRTRGKKQLKRRGGHDGVLPGYRPCQLGLP